MSKKTGRPEKSESEAKSERVAFRLTIDERLAIEAKAVAVGATVSEYARAAALTARAPRPQNEQAGNPAMLAELNRVGVNLNQIARSLNRGGAVPSDLSEVLDQVRSLVEKIARGGG